MPKARQPEPIDLNILPAQYRPREISPITKLLWVIAGALFLLTLPAFLIGRSQRLQLRELTDELGRAQETLKIIRTPAPEVVALTEQLDHIEKALKDIDAIAPELARRRDWPPTLGALLSFNRDRVRLTELFQDGDDLVLTGLALIQDDVLTYAGTLDRSGVFERVIIQSMQSVEQPFATHVPAPTGAQLTPGASSDGTPSPSETPSDALTATAVPTPPETRLPSPTPTHAFYDGYEIDDFEARPINLGETQRHNFNPVYDIDQVTFLGVAGKRYCIQALPEAAGVDTYLEVTVGESVYTNDDCQTGLALYACNCPQSGVGASQASVVELLIRSSYDQGVWVKVTNQGEYGPDKWYTLYVAEAGGDSGTGVGGDIYEPDGDEPSPLLVNERQKHTFYPEGDIDRVEFDLRGGYLYQIETYSLTVGVDTVLSVLADGVLYQNDDAAPGNSASRVVFTAARDGVAGVTLTNRGQYGPDSEYWLVLTEMVGTPTPEPTATLSPTPTPTPDCVDAYEPDDIVGHPMIVGVQEAHNFCPLGDVDRAVFTAKAGHAYRVETTDLMLGVDTYLAVQLGESTTSSDDRSPQDFSSSVRVQNTTSGDLPAFIAVTNKGLFGIEMTYNLRVSDLGASDAYEPDDVNGVEILVGVPQSRTFSPDGDVDRVYFMAAPYHIYRIHTANLASGVDTVLAVDVGSNHFTNDDKSPGDPSSSVEFPIAEAAPIRVLVTVSNKGDYAPDKAYTLQVDELSEGDAYEVDDALGVLILVGGVQERTFFPQNDVDKVYFTAEAGHRYGIYTYDLASGVDTVLDVEMGTIYLTNDNRATGDPSSYVDLSNESLDNAQVMVTIRNNGQYGNERSYSIGVDELGTGSGDDYEPDLTAKRMIWVGEVQRHTFYPVADIDRVTLIVRAGQRYPVMTCGSDSLPGGAIGSTDPFSPGELACEPLMSGVDTYLVVTGPIRDCEPSGCQSDDVLPGTEYSNSRVEFDALVDGEVTITIYNNAGVFGPAMAYYLRVHELGTSSTPTVSPTPTSTQSATPSTPTATSTGTLIPPTTPSPTQSPYALPGTPTPSTAAPSPTATSVLTATPTATTGAYPLSSRGGRMLFFKPLFKVLSQDTGSGAQTIIKFKLLLRMAPIGQSAESP